MAAITPEIIAATKHHNKRIDGRMLHDIYSLIYIYTTTSDKATKFSIAFDLDEYRNRFLLEAENICLRELRHLSVKNDAWVKYHMDYSHNCLSPLFTIPMRRRISGILSYAYGKEPTDRESRDNRYFKGFLTFADINKKVGVKLFTWETVNILFYEDVGMKSGWAGKYGGEKWYAFSKQCQKLDEASHDKIWFFIDRAINLCHNCDGKFLEKFFYFNQLLLTANLISDKLTTYPMVLEGASSGVAGNCRRYIRQERVQAE